MTRTVFDNHGVAHIWAQANQDSGRSNNGQFFFEGRALYSYGTHFLVGYIMPDGVALLNSDSYSISTARHQRLAAGAVSHRASYRLPELTGLRYALARIARGDLEPIEIRRYCEEYAPSLAGQFPRATDAQESEAARLAEIDAPAAGNDWQAHYRARARHLAAIQEAAGTPDALAYVLGLVGLSRSRKAILAAYDKAQKKKNAERLARKEAESERQARILAAETIQESHFGPRRSWSGYLSAVVARSDAESVLKRAGVEILRAQKWTKGRRGFLTIHKTLKARRAEIRAILGNLAARQARAWANRETRLAIAILRDLAGQEAGAALSRQVMSYAPFIHVPGSNAGAYNAPADDDNRAELVTLATDRALFEIARASAAAPSIKARAQAARAAIADNAQAIKERRAARALADVEARHAERLEKERAQREAWLAGDPAARFSARDQFGGAYLRAVNVTRDDSGNITGGELQTSQGARVPLTHALRVFRFLKLCRESGRTWHKNGHTLRVGHYQVDSVEADGTFRAGCHLIRWAQVESLADRLGVAGLAAADETELTRGAA